MSLLHYVDWEEFFICSGIRCQLDHGWEMVFFTLERLLNDLSFFIHEDAMSKGNRNGSTNLKASHEEGRLLSFGKTYRCWTVSKSDKQLLLTS